MANGKYERLERKLIHRGAVIDEYTDVMSLPDGSIQNWDLVDHVGAAAVVPVLPDGRILLVRQYRNPSEEEMLEIPAGKLDSRREPASAAAERELSEETGYTTDTLEHLLVFRPTVAYSNERIDIYLARDLRPGRQHPDPGEFLNLEAHQLDELLEQIYSGQIKDGKTIAGLLAYAWRYKRE